MKCEKCGRYDATCHYTSNINGKVTEQHLCGECAGEFDMGRSFFAEADRMFDMAFAGFDRFGGFDSFDRFFGFPRRRALSPWGFGYAMPALVIPRPCVSGECAAPAEAAAPADAAPTEAAAPAASEADPELKKRREINALREEMRAAAEAEDFEKAAEIRDKLREMEK